MKARYRYRIYPNQQQQTKLAKLFGCCRVVWNDALVLYQQSEKLPKNGDLQKICITQAKLTEERQWLFDCLRRLECVGNGQESQIIADNCSSRMARVSDNV
ncbi:MAG: helix-turn-helix domain-containing protein [Lyngbya sp.]|nr:helix-turn-helix domain-containing protein [Lyngbya sp.]